MIAEPGSGRLQRVRRESPTQQVRDQLLLAIETGDYPPGSQLPSERALCETFGVSRVSLREAIAGLEALGLVTVQHGKGAYVREPLRDQLSGPFQHYLQLHREEMLDLINVRGALDELAAELAALEGTDEDVSGLIAAHEAFRAEVESADINLERLALLDVAFHLAIGSAAHNLLLGKLLADLHGVMQQSRRVTLARSPRQPTVSVVEHQAIVDAIMAHDARRARQAAQKHLSGIRAWLTQSRAEPAIQK